MVSLAQDGKYFIDNFATGLRGAKIAESFVKSGYSVVYFHRKGCILPFSQKFELEFVQNNYDQIKTILAQTKTLSESIVLVEFETVFEYLYKLM